MDSEVEELLQYINTILDNTDKNSLFATLSREKLEQIKAVIENKNVESTKLKSFIYNNGLLNDYMRFAKKYNKEHKE